ncbi:hypothetical protein PV646_02970 [Streptomyces sp. ID05-26A]|nr:hypothetical protein [Streptomyces sp. ID05-26A]
MSGFTRDPKYYGDRLVYEALTGKWGRYHDSRCGCGNNWITHHAVPAGFTVVRDGGSFVVFVGPGLTEDVDEQRLTTGALWEAVTGELSTQDWFEQVIVIDRSPAAEAERKADNDRMYAPLRARAAASKTEPISPAQLKYVESLITGASKERFAAEFAAAIKGTKIAARGERERAMTAVKRLTKSAARRLITGLKT